MRRIWVSSIEEKNKWVTWVKKGIELCIYANKYSCFQPNDMFSKSLDMDLPYMSIDLQSEFDKVIVAVLKEVSYNYDYYYMLNSLNEACEEKTNTIVTGSSYSVFGFEKSHLVGSVNLGLGSQDLYYALKGVYNVIDKNSNIENVVVLAGPYYFFSDLSRSQNTDELLRISKVYQPLYKDVHNAIFLEPKKCFLPESCIWNVSKVVEAYSISEYQRNYFNEDRPRENLGARTWTRNCGWHSLTEEERVVAGEKRASLHNKSIKYESSFLENKAIFKDFIKDCNERKINVLMVITPTTRYYREFLDKRFLEIFYEVLNECTGIVHLIDLYDSNDFDNNDFNDVDHLSENGAKKLTKIISDLLHSL